MIPSWFIVYGVANVSSQVDDTAQDNPAEVFAQEERPAAEMQKLKADKNPTKKSHGKSNCISSTRWGAIQADGKPFSADEKVVGRELHYLDHAVDSFRLRLMDRWSAICIACDADGV